MSWPYRIGSVMLLVIMMLVTLGSMRGWGVTSEVRAAARAAAYSSVRAGGLHRRHHYGGGPGFGK